MRAATLRGGCPRLRFVGNARSITRRSSSAPSHPRRHRSKGHCPKRHDHPSNNPYPTLPPTHKTLLEILLLFWSSHTSEKIESCPYTSSSIRRPLVMDIAAHGLINHEIQRRYRVRRSFERHSSFFIFLSCRADRRNIQLQFNASSFRGKARIG